MSRRSVLLMLALAAVAVIALGARHAVAGDGPPPATGVVERVVDGDTVIVRAGGGALRVRLLGIDTPETVDPDRPVGCFGPEASAYTKHLLTGRSVSLVYDRELHDRYGRLLAYVYLRRPVRQRVAGRARVRPDAVDPAEHRTCRGAGVAGAASGRSTAAGCGVPARPDWVHCG